MTLLLVAYDVSDNRRRARLHALLSGYGQPVQESVFECELDDARRRSLQRALKRTVRPGDRVRLYPLCAACAARVIDASGTERPPAPEVYLD
mgnify:CR=1 FL=1